LWGKITIFVNVITPRHIIASALLFLAAGTAREQQWSGSVDVSGGGVHNWEYWHVSLKMDGSAVCLQEFRLSGRIQSAVKTRF
jgi:hypothetical protein